MAKEETREYILKKAFELFINRGYKSVTMIDLEKATGLTKGAFYHYFKDKSEIFKAAVDLQIESFRFNFLPHEDEENITLRDFISLIIAHEEKLSKDFSKIAPDCVFDVQLGFLVSDICNYMPNLIDTIKDIIKQNYVRWEKILFGAKERGEIRSDIETSIIVQLFTNIPESVKRNKFLNKSLQHSLNLMRVQYDQLYALISN